MSRTSEIKSFMLSIVSAIDSGVTVRDLKNSVDSLIAINNLGFDKNRDRIIDCVSGIYGVKKSIILKKHLRGDAQDVKQICYCIMKYEYGMSIREIAKVFKTNHNSVRIGINRLKSLSEKVSNDIKFKETYEKALIKLKINNYYE
jgi:chromosomal replication initiation ATPase DnaA